MEEILASIRRIIADDDGKPAKPLEPAMVKPTPAVAVASQPAPRAPAPPPRAMANDHDDIDAIFADLQTPAAEPPPSDVLNLTEEMTAPATESEPAASFATVDASSDVVFTDPPPEPAPHTIEQASRPTPQATAPERALISSSTLAAVDSAFNSLANTVIGQNARTLEDLVKEMLRPMLKSWLDDNLPGLVDRVVRAEIERVSRGRS
jgi:uncharacterized protein